MSLSLQKKQGYTAFYFPELEVSCTGHGFTSRQGPAQDITGPFASLNMGLKTGDDPQCVQENQQLFLKSRNLSGYPLLTGEQIHGAGVFQVTQDSSFCTPGADALISAQPGVVLAMFSADCALLYFVDTKARAVGISHAGWRGSALGIGGKTVHLFKKNLGIEPKDIKVGISPCIGPCCFEVGEDVLSSLEKEGLDIQEIITPMREGKWWLDLAGLNRMQLLEAGVKGENIYSADVCTFCREDLFYSHRRDKGITGRMMGYVHLDGKDR